MKPENYTMIPVLFMIASLVFSCGKKKEDDKAVVSKTYTEEGDSATLSLSFANNTATNLISDLLTPSYFGLKVISVELVDSNSRYVSIWVNPTCTPETLSVDFEVDMTAAEIEEAREAIRKKEGLSPEATIDPGTKKVVSYPYKDAQKCKAADVTSFIDLARTSAEVNTEINSQGLPVPPGTYQSVSVRLCHPDESSFKAQKFLATGMSAASEVTGSGCGVTGAPSTNIEVEKGDEAKVQLSYNLASFVEKTVYSGPSTLPAQESNTNCYLDAGAYTYYCSKLGASSITPSIVSTTK